MRHLAFILPALLLCTASMAQKPSGRFAEGIRVTPLVIAHRGGALIGIENSISCLDNAIKLGVDMVEIDVHMSADGKLVVCHDETIDRTTDGKGSIESMTLDSLRTFHLLDYKTGEPTDEVLPTLGEVLALIHGQCGLLLEVKKKKGQYEGIEAAILQEVYDYEAQEWVVFQSFNDSVIEKFHELDPSIPVEKLIVCRIGAHCIDGGMVKFNFKKYSYVTKVNTMMCSKSFVKKAHAHGIGVGVWTVNKKSKAPKYHVDGIITNVPDQFVK